MQFGNIFLSCNLEIICLSLTLKYGLSSVGATWTRITGREGQTENKLLSVLVMAMIWIRRK